MSDSLPILYTVDDLYEKSQIVEHLVPLHKANSDFRITCFCIPNKLGPVHDLVNQYPWITFAQHGREHTHFECLTWTQEKAEEIMQRNLDEGYAPIFKPPNWKLDEETCAAAAAKNILLVIHDADALGRQTPPLFQPASTHMRSYSSFQLHHTHITKNPATTFISDLEEFTPEYVSKVKAFTELGNA